MGVVWLARDEKLDREVALKFLPEVVKSDRSAMDDLKRETRRALDLTHTHIVRIYDFVEDATTAAIAMEYVPGDTLSNRRLDQPAKVFEAGDVRRWVKQLCEALVYAHEKARIVHRDLKPANLMLDAHGDLKIADFGISRSISDSVSRVSNQAGSSGTLLYMSPQQMMGEEPAVTDDVYSLGATLYELLTGKPPFYTGNVMLQVQTKMPSSIAERRQTLEVSGAPIPAEWDATIAACLAKESAQRPQNVREVAHRLGLTVTMDDTAAPFAPGPARTGSGLPPPTKSSAPPVVPKTKAPAGRYAIVAAAVLAAAGAGYYFGIYAPAQQREAEIRQRDEQGKMAEAARVLANQAADELRTRIKADQVSSGELEIIAREQTPRGQVARERGQELQHQRELAEQQAYTQISAALEKLAENSPRTAYDQAELDVRVYLATAPERFKGAVEKEWNRRRAAGQAFEAANRPGALAVETDPPGATITLYPANIRKTSPANFREVKPGEVSFRVEKEGYEPQDVAFVIKPGVEGRADQVRLVPMLGTAVVSSEPSGLRVVLEGNGRRHEGITPFTQPMLSPGTYRVTLQRARWQPVVKQLIVERGKETPLFADLQGVAWDIRSEPAGATVTLDGNPAGVTPLRLEELEPRSYRLALSLAGFEDFAQTYPAGKNDVATVKLVEKPLTALLRRLTGHTWRYQSGWGYAEFAFDSNGSITGSHKIPLAAVMEDLGRIQSPGAGTDKFAVTFTPSRPYPFYTGEVTMQLLDDNNLQLNWRYNGAMQNYTYTRTDSAAGVSKNVNVFMGKAPAAEAARRKKK
jgi:hypothetical protein